MKKSMRELLERSFCGDEVIKYIEELEKNNTLLEREKKALSDEAEMKCELNHQLQKKVDRLAEKLADLAINEIPCIELCPIGNPKECNGECLDANVWKELTKKNE